MEFLEVINTLAEKTSYTPRELRHMLYALRDVITDSLIAGEDVQIWRLGTFRNKAGKSRVGRHPVTGEQIPIPETRRVKFTPSKSLAKSVAKSMDVFKEEDLETRFGLKENNNGEIRSSNRPRKS